MADGAVRHRRLLHSQKMLGAKMVWGLGLFCFPRAQGVSASCIEVQSIMRDVLLIWSQHTFCRLQCIDDEGALPDRNSIKQLDAAKADKKDSSSIFSHSLNDRLAGVTGHGLLCA